MQTHDRTTPGFATATGALSPSVTADTDAVGNHVPVHLDVPHIEILFLDVPDRHTPLEARGLAEIGITGAAAAVANAVFHATGRRIRDLPITLDKLL
jgi:CO/xanthine dehydrogenase Mo-binding subunit